MVANRVLFYVLAGVLTVFFLGPFVWTVISSLKQPSEITAYPPVFIPAVLRFDNYAAAWAKVPFLLFYANSAIVTVLAVLGQIVSATLVAYGFARFNFPMHNVLFLLVIATLIVPWEVTIVPSFILYRWLGSLDTLKPLIVPFLFVGSTLFLFLLRPFFMSIPRDLDQAAGNPGAHSFCLLWQILCAV